MRVLKVVLLLVLLSSCCSGQSIQDYIDQAITKGDDHVVIPPGVYNTSKDANGNLQQLSFLNVNNFALYAYGVTFLSTIRARALDITNCINVSIHGLTIDYAPLTFTQGTIVAINNFYLDLKIHAGYPIEQWNRINVVDPATGFFKDGMGFMWDTVASIPQPGVVRINRTSGAGFYTAELGDYATLAGGPDGEYACHGIATTNTSGVALVDTTIYCAPGFGFADWGGGGGTVLNNFQLIPGPTPPGATFPRYQTSSWDGIEHSSTTKGPWVNNIKIELAGDDTWSSVGGSWTIAAIDQTSQTIVFEGSAPFPLEVGDTLRLRNPEQYPNEEVAVVNVDMGVYKQFPIHAFYCAACAAKALRQEFVSPNFTVLVDRSIPSNWAVGDNLFAMERQSTSFVFQNSYIRSKGRGALVKSPYGLIQNNHFEGGTAGVEVSPELEGASGSDACVGYALTIRNNTIVHTGYHETFDDPTYGADGAIAFFSYMTGQNFSIRGPNAFRNMVVEGNTFSQVNGINIGIAASDGVVVINNNFENTMPVQYSTQGSAFGWNNGYVVFITESSNVTLENNVVHGESKFKVGNLFVSSSVSGLKGNITQEE